MIDTFSHPASKVVTLVAVVMSMGCFFLAGCTAIGSTQSGFDMGSVDQVYQVSTQEALDLAKGALESVLPDNKSLPLTKPRVGFLVHQARQKGEARYARFRETNYVYELDLIPMEGDTPQGERVSGYSYTISGKGDLKEGPANVAQIDQHLKAAFEESGQAIAVVSAHRVSSVNVKRTADKPPSPKAASPAPGVSPSISASPATPEATGVQQGTAAAMPASSEEPTATDDDTFTKLKKLKELLDQGVITEEEFQMKKRELLERI